jgi:hypothetical protein
MTSTPERSPGGTPPADPERSPCGPPPATTAERCPDGCELGSEVRARLRSVRAVEVSRSNRPATQSTMLRAPSTVAAWATSSSRRVARRRASRRDTAAVRSAKSRSRLSIGRCSNMGTTYRTGVTETEREFDAQGSHRSSLIRSISPPASRNTSIEYHSRHDVIPAG